MKPTVAETKKQFIDVIEGRYALAQNHRGDEFATFNHFESTFLDQLNDQEKTKVAKEVFLALQVKSLSRYFWLVSVYKLRLWQFAFDLLAQEKDNSKKKALLEAVLSSVRDWTREDCSSVFGTKEANTLLDQASLLGISVADEDIKKLS